MRYSIELEKKVRQLVSENKPVSEIAKNCNVSKKVIYRWCPELLNSDEQLRVSVKQKFHSVLPQYEAKITSCVAPYMPNSLPDDTWEMIQKNIATQIFEQTVSTYKAALQYTLNETDAELPKICTSDENFITYLKRFWNFNKSEYVQDRQKKGLSIRIEYVRQNHNCVKYWEEWFDKKSLNEVTVNDVLSFKDKLIQKGYSNNKINLILHSGVTALKFAYQRFLTSNDCFSNMTYLPRQYAEGIKIDESVIEDLFTQKWESQEAFVGNLTAYITGLKYCELVALRLSDITDNVIHIRNIYSNELKPCKKKDERDLVVSEKLIDMLKDYASTSPYGEGFIFYGLDKDKPSACRFFTGELKEKLNGLGLTSSEISFSLWRNIYKNRRKCYFVDCSSSMD